MAHGGGSEDRTLKRERERKRRRRPQKKTIGIKKRKVNGRISIKT